MLLVPRVEKQVLNSSRKGGTAFHVELRRVVKQQFYTHKGSRTEACLFWAPSWYNFLSAMKAWISTTEVNRSFGSDFSESKTMASMKRRNYLSGRQLVFFYQMTIRTAHCFGICKKLQGDALMGREGESCMIYTYMVNSLGQGLLFCFVFVQQLVQ